MNVEMFTNEMKGNVPAPHQDQPDAPEVCNFKAKEDVFQETVGRCQQDSPLKTKEKTTFKNLFI